MRALRILLSRQFFIYVTGGVMSAVIDIGAMVLLLRMGMDTLYAATFGFVLGLVVNYLFHVQMTFATRKTLQSVSRFMMIVGLNYGVTLACVLIVQSLGLNPVVGKLASLPIVALNGFFLGKYWAFR